jgi:hypothetical protein
MLIEVLPIVGDDPIAANGAIVMAKSLPFLSCKLKEQVQGFDPPTSLPGTTVATHVFGTTCC